MAGRGIIKDSVPAAQLTECYVEVPVTLDCHALAVSLESLATQLRRQPAGRRHGKIRLDSATRRMVVTLQE